MTIQPKLTLEAELSVPMKATDIRAFLDAAERSMDDMTVEARPLGGQMDEMSMKLTATGTAKSLRAHSHPAYRYALGDQS